MRGSLERSRDDRALRSTRRLGRPTITPTALHHYQGRHSTTRTRYGARIPVTTSDLIQRYLYLFGTWEPNLTAWIHSRLRPGDTFIDVGANLGHFSLLAAPLVGPSGRVVAIEASPRFARSLTQAATANGHANIRVIGSAVAAAAGELCFYIKDEHNLGGTTSIRPRTAPPPSFSAPCASLPELLSDTELETARIIKIDVEGAEADAIDGLAPRLGTLRPDVEIAVEVSPRRLARQGRTPDDITTVMGAAGFNCYRIDNSYAARSYTTGTVTPPRRLRQPVLEMSDLIFSRRDDPIDLQ